MSTMPPAPLSPPLGIPLGKPGGGGAIVLSDPPRAAHSTPHHVAGICICPCLRCTDNNGKGGLTRCICPDCPTPRAAAGCGAKTGVDGNGVSR